MQIIADLQLHSKYSRAVSKHMVLPEIAEWAGKKGIDLVATGDWMHPVWMSELKAGLKEWSEGIYASKENPDGAKFLLSGELSSIYTEHGQGRRVHTLVFSPSIEVCLAINIELRKRGCNLSSDGRPIIGLSVKEIAEIAFSIDERCLVIPAHAWTPWFGLYGSKSGFDSIGEAFGELADRIYAVETGLSSDPAMNWRIAELERRAIVSFSDAHSPAKLGREATVFQTVNSKLEIPRKASERGRRNSKFTYSDIYWAIAERSLGKNSGSLEIAYTVEFYPEEGKYHWDGHRKCNVVHSPDDTRKKGIQCSVCGKPLTVGVEYRVEQLATMGKENERNSVFETVKRTNDVGVVGYFHPTDTTRPPYVMIVPLLEILSEVMEAGVGTKKVLGEYERLIGQFGSEFEVLLKASVDDLESVGGARVSEGIKKVREGSISISPGYDGVFGKVRIWGDDSTDEEKEEQMVLF